MIADGPGPPRPEPIGTTPADLLALIAGVALAAALPWSSGRPEPAWFMALAYAQEGLPKGCMALIPVVITRRARFGGPIRPGEFLAFWIGFSQLVFELSLLPILGLVSPILDRGRLQGYQLRPEAYRAFELGQLGLGVLAALTLLARRRRLHPAVAGALVLVAWVDIGGPLRSLLRGLLDPILGSIDRASLAAHAFSLLWHLPLSVVFYLPAIVAIADLFRRGGRGLTWVEWAGLGLVVPWWFAMRAFRATILFQNTLPPRSLAAILVFDAWEILVSAALATLLVRRVGRPLGCWLGLGPDGPWA